MSDDDDGRVSSTLAVSFDPDEVKPLGEFLSIEPLVHYIQGFRV